MFAIGDYYPLPEHRERIRKYRDNKKLFLGKHYDVFQRIQNKLSRRQSELLYISTNLPGVICKKSADFLFGEQPVFSAGKSDQSTEQAALDRFVEENDLHILNYESALSNAYRGDSFYKIRYGQAYAGVLSKDIDPYRVMIEAQNPEYVFPETAVGDANRIIAFHIGYPVAFNRGNGDEWRLHVESHYPGRIIYAKYKLEPILITVDNEIGEWRIAGEIAGERQEVQTGVPFPLVVHVPNYATDDHWEGIDDLSENKPLFDEINHRISQIASILDKHADPAMAVPAGTLGEDAEGNPIFRVGVDKVFEVMGKDEVIPQYITWDGQLQAAFTELEHLVKLLLINAEIPEIALGSGDVGTSGASGLAIKWRLNSILAKINRKRQYYNKALKRVLLIAQLLEVACKGPQDYEVTVPKVKFKDGLPDDETEMANIMSIRTGGKATISQKSALMWLDDLTEEQADAELQRIQDEEAVTDPSAFQQPMTGGGGDN
ncbi:phage portal protein [Heliophilum fasciatum]|uniref:SPP1 Gp6-like portal protein n=1 Tax=Heliophilum fasciatum TaxID=35700 RepID=A0A4R2REL3_9FIRM|nr:phage portal protein [Heliophilum fasciatum]MCW2279099.1 hypothetical protein [Heliophilum fasciatum]TCP61273.1 SPP1 Gp6-like portal protein [Heliophilum fasciatum]